MADSLILVYGCSSLVRPLRERGLQAKAIRHLSQLLRSSTDRQARAIVLATKTLDSDRLRSALAELKKAWALVDIIAWEPGAGGTRVREALRAGASDVILTSSESQCCRRIVEVVEGQQLLPRAARSDARSSDSFEGMVSRSPRMWDLFDTVRRVAQTDATVLILGETGTGKELLARAVHRQSARAGRFVALNCAAVSTGLIDSELFGHVRGAFTGALKDKEGLFRHAEAGTLMLDEIGNVPLPVQHRLLRVLQEGTVRPLGGHQEVAVDARVIAATSNALEQDVQAERFREDLFYRLDVLRLEIPPLRERPEDIVLLFAHFAKKAGERYNIERPDIRDDFLDALVSYRWPGNVRQLENLSERIVLTQHGRRLTADDFRRVLPFKANKGGARGPGPQRSAKRLPPRVDVERSLEENMAPHLQALEREYLEACLEAEAGRAQAAADRAGISRRTLLRKLKQHGLERLDYR